MNAKKDVKDAIAEFSRLMAGGWPSQDVVGAISKAVHSISGDDNYSALLSLVIDEMKRIGIAK